MARPRLVLLALAAMAALAVGEIHLPGLISSQSGTTPVQRAKGVPHPHNAAPRAAAHDDTPPSSAGTPAHEQPRGLEEVARAAAKDNAVVVTWANHHYEAFVRSWVARLRASGVTNYCVGAMDRALYDELHAAGEPVFFMGSQKMDEKSVRGDFGWGSQKFHHMGRDKIRLIRDVLLLGLDVLVSDVDVAWMRDPLPHFRRFPTADLLVSTDQLHNTSGLSGSGLLEHHICATASNIGIMWIRATPNATAMASEWVDAIERDPKVWDQNAFNTLKMRGDTCRSQDRFDGGLMRAYDGRVLMGALPVVGFSNGHTFFVQRLHERFGEQAYAVHATFQYSGTEGKRHRMREAGVWEADRRGYAEGTFLTYEPTLPAGVDLAQFSALGWPSKDSEHTTLEPDSPALAAHKRLVEDQLMQLRDALAVAWLLGRTLVAPPVLCGLDRAWFPHYGRFPGSSLALPFVCPLDHVLELTGWMRQAKRREDGSPPLREHSFRRHPMLTGEERNDTAVAVLTELPGRKRVGELAGLPEGVGEYLPAAGAAATVDLSADVTEPLFEDGVLDRLGGAQLAARKFLHLTTVEGLFKGFRDTKKGDACRREQALEALKGEWCCHKSGNYRYSVTAHWP